MRYLSCSFPRGRRTILIILLTIFCLSGNAQDKVSGIVTDNENNPVPGATISIKSSNQAVYSNTDGKFTIHAAIGNTLIISSIGYRTREILINDYKEIHIYLSRATLYLDEILVTGYTDQKYKEITGSVSIIKQKQLTTMPAGQVEQMLQGLVAGLDVISDGEPGSKPNVRLHGIGNFGNVTPLYIIDGVQGDVNSMNPYDIESIQVLKDAGAYSIYGVRGANGVILVTTKKGVNGKTRLTYEAYLGITTPLSNGLDLLNPQENANLLWKVLKNSNLSNINTLYGNSNNSQPVLPDYLFAGPYRGLKFGDPRANASLYNINPSANPIYQIVTFNKQGTDWFHEVFKPALQQNHVITASGGNESNNYLFSLGYLNQQGTMINTFLKRITSRINSSFKIKNIITIGENLQISNSENPRSSNSGFFSPWSREIYSTFLTNPYLPVYDIKGGFSSNGSEIISPEAPLYGPAGNIVAVRKLSKDDKNGTWQIFGNVFAEIKIGKHLSFKTLAGGSFSNQHAYTYKFGSYQPPLSGPNNLFTERSGYAQSFIWTNTLNYTGKFLKHHDIQFLSGIEQINNSNREVGGTRTGYYTDFTNYRFLGNGNPIGQSNYSFATFSNYFSFINQLNYRYREKYYVTTTLRKDGSSLFGAANRFGWFPSISGAWRISQEKFLKVLACITELKFRASWGKTGFSGNVDQLNQYPVLYWRSVQDSYYDIYGRSTGSIEPGFRALRVGNPKTSWQEDIVFNIGLDANLLHGKIIFTADFYNKQSKGLLFPFELPAVLGNVIPPLVNAGNIRNRGFDITLGSKGSINRFGWNSTITVSRYKNLIVQLNNVPFFDDVPTRNGYLIRNEVGHPISSFYGYRIVGLFNDPNDVKNSPIQNAAAPGRFKYQDSNGDDTISDVDRVHFGNPHPSFILGLNIGFDFMGFDFSSFLYGRIGSDVLNDLKNTFDIIPSQPSLTPKSRTALYNSWTTERRNVSAPIAEISQNFSNAQVINSYRLEKGSYFRNKSLLLGYTLPVKWLKNVHIDRARIYVQVLNLFTISNYNGLDPELPGTSSAFGIDFGNYPNNQKQYLVGLHISL